MKIEYDQEIAEILTEIPRQTSQGKITITTRDKSVCYDTKNRIVTLTTPEIEETFSGNDYSEKIVQFLNETPCGETYYNAARRGVFQGEHKMGKDISVLLE